jgi:hypothetical protein
VSDIASDVEAIISRMKPWDSPQSYTSADVPDWEYLRSSAKALVYWFREMRDDLGRARAERDALKRELDLHRQDNYSEGEILRGTIRRLEGELAEARRDLAELPALSAPVKKAAKGGTA